LPRHIRPAFAALWGLDLAFADVISTSSDARLGAIRLAWWRERLEQLDGGSAAPAEPRLRAVAGELLSRGVSGKQLSELEDVWLPLLEPFPWQEPQANGLRRRGEILFGIGARLLGCEARTAEAAGALWSFHDGAAHCSDAASREFLVEQARKAIGHLPPKVAAATRPLTMLAALAACDLSGGGRFVRGAAALKHRLTGRFPR
jgi:phytoene synthase